MSNQKPKNDRQQTQWPVEKGQNDNENTLVQSSIFIKTKP